MGAPLIGLTGRKSSGQVLGAPGGFADAQIDVYFSEYAASVRLAGGIPVHLSPEGGPAVVDRIDGLLLAGGSDIAPGRYGEIQGPHTGPVDLARDQYEFDLLDAALQRRIPVLGVCRGHQLINVAMGGTLVQHIEAGSGDAHADYAIPRGFRSHEILLEEGTMLRQLYGSRSRVNSFHHQAVAVPGSGVTVAARAADGVIEGIEIRDDQVLGVQWHPECFGNDPIFQWLVEASRNSEGTL